MIKNINLTHRLDPNMNNHRWSVNLRVMTGYVTIYRSPEQELHHQLSVMTEVPLFT